MSDSRFLQFPACDPVSGLPLSVRSGEAAEIGPAAAAPMGRHVGVAGRVIGWLAAAMRWRPWRGRRAVIQAEIAELAVRVGSLERRVGAIEGATVGERVRLGL